MDIESKHAVKMLDALVSTHSMFSEYARRLRSRPDVVEATHTFQSLGLPTLEWYVEAKLHNGKMVIWGTVVTWNNIAWHIESMISVNDDQGQYTIKDFPDRETETLVGFSENLIQAADDLIQSEEVIMQVIDSE
jgi:hypothetical protein